MGILARAYLTPINRRKIFYGMLAYGVAPRRSQVATGDTYASRYGPRFIRRRQAAFSPFAAGGGFPHGRGSPAPLCAKTRYPAATGKASLPLPKNSTYYKGFTSGYAALVIVPFFVAPPLPPQRVFLRAALRAAGFSAALRFASGVCVPHPAALKKRCITK